MSPELFRGPKLIEAEENRTPSAAAGYRRSSVKLELAKAAAAMEVQPKSSRKEKKAKRQEILERKKKIDKLIQAASSEHDHLSSFPPFRRFDRNGLCVVLESGNGDKLSAVLKQYIQNLLKVNMEGPFGEEWPEEEKVKRREMVSPEARYIFVKEESPEADNDKTAAFVGFVHFRFTLEEEIPVLYVYEIQLESRVQGKGLGKFLMQLVELIAQLYECCSVNSSESQCCSYEFLHEQVEIHNIKHFTITS